MLVNPRMAPPGGMAVPAGASAAKKRPRQRAPSLFSYRRLADGKYALLPSGHAFGEEVVAVSFMITLWAGSSPPVLARLPDVQLRHLAVFTSRSREEGRCLRSIRSGCPMPYQCLS